MRLRKSSRDRKAWLGWSLLIGLFALGASTGHPASGAELDGSPEAPAAVETPERYELFFELNAEVRSRRFDADIEASARLEAVAVVAGGDSPSTSQTTLSLVGELQPATKYYRIDPAGPMGSEAKMAAEVTLPDGSWEALEIARREVDQLGRAAHNRWAQRTGGSQSFDGAFAFVVIGEPSGRFLVEVGSTGRVESVENRLTDRWLNGPFDRYVGRWGAAGDGADSSPGSTIGSPSGYWFWNEGESEPFDYEPHVYHAFEEALRLLGQPLPEEGRRLSWPGLAEDLLDILRTLVPKAERRIEPPRLTDASLTLAGPETATTAPGASPAVTLQRSTNAATLEIVIREEGLLVELTVGFKPR